MRFPRTLPGFELIENRIITVASTSETFSDLNGDDDGLYLFKGSIINPTAGLSVYDLRPNGLTTNLSMGVIDVVASSGVQSSVGLASWFAGFAAAAGETRFSIEIEASKLIAATARRRFMQGIIFGNGSYRAGSGQWNETATNLTSLDVVASAALSIGVGSILRLFREVRSF